MDVTIAYSVIISRCEQLSSFEADSKMDTNGESRYLEIHINEVDKKLINRYAEQAVCLIREQIERMIETESMETGGVTWGFRTNTRHKENSAISKHLEEAVVCYTMAAWLKGKLDDRAAFYEGVFKTSLELAINNLFTKQAPTYSNE